MDEDQCARRNAQKYLKIIDPDYYEFEAHIFFDDAFDQVGQHSIGVICTCKLYIRLLISEWIRRANCEQIREADCGRDGCCSDVSTH